jgi:hypothetical protein
MKNYDWTISFPFEKLENISSRSARTPTNLNREGFQREFGITDPTWSSVQLAYNRKETPQNEENHKKTFNGK